jgi:hypothetical protein
MARCTRVKCNVCGLIFEENITWPYETEGWVCSVCRGRRRKRMEKIKPMLTMDESIELIEEYLGNLSERTPPDPPSLGVCQAMKRIIFEYSCMNNYVSKLSTITTVEENNAKKN